MTRIALGRKICESNCEEILVAECLRIPVYFCNKADALRFALVAGSIMSGEEARSENLLQETARVTRIRISKVATSAPETLAS